ncbi:hypothetical protein L1049_017999 [Liquidambar formosana]|uniref:cytokinin riboside 5'-monophosphate phosphoribohydrolase n=1 Tax=Liquidambar formosana TaxID=63359 RepID=A0AAP0R7M6_LIQFO
MEEGNTRSKFKRVCVFCGSQSGRRNVFSDAALELGNELVGLLNVDGYYDFLLKLFDNGVEEGFIKPGARQIVVSAPTAKELMAKMEQYTPSHDHVAPHESWQMEQLGDYPGQQSPQ